MKVLLFITFEILIAIIIISVNLQVFLIYAFIMIVWHIHYSVDFLRKLIRTFQIHNEIKIEAISKKIGVTSKDIKEAQEEYMQQLTEKQIKQIEKEVISLL